MGKMIFLSDFYGSPLDRVARPKLNASWYFSESYQNGDRMELTDDIIAVDFPHMSAIHDDDMNPWDTRNVVRVNIRRCIEQVLAGDVLISQLERDYRIRDDNRPWDSGRLVRHGYWIYRFQFQTDQIAFALHFGGILTTVEDRRKEDRLISTNE